MKGMRSVRIVALALVVPVLALAAPLAAQDGLCDQVELVADGWSALADELDAAATEGLDEARIEEIDALLREGIARERGLADHLLAQGGAGWSDLGARLHEDLDALEAAPDIDATILALDDLVDTLDLFLEDCDAAAAAPAPAPAATGAISVGYQPSPGYGELAGMLHRSGVFEGIAEMVGSVVALPADLRVVFQECGEPNAFYQDGQVTMCYEFFDLFFSVFSQSTSDQEELLDNVVGTGAFFYLHELGHALVHLLEIPITGREEDSVDALATLILLHGGNESALFAAIENFDAMAAMAEGQGQFAFWDEHSLDSQRLYDVACLIFGSNPEAYAGMVGPEALPVERAQRCPQEFEQKDRAWDELLAPHYLE